MLGQLRLKWRRTTPCRSRDRCPRRQAVLYAMPLLLSALLRSNRASTCGCCNRITPGRKSVSASYCSSPVLSLDVPTVIIVSFNILTLSWRADGPFSACFKLALLLLCADVGLEQFAKPAIRLASRPASSLSTRAATRRITPSPRARSMKAGPRRLRLRAITTRAR